ncbi:MAG: class I SAM-dependent methyltransferase [Sedimentisphaerales bacterium]|nr:class I SAM-dependent methyltransferase [Sedimentisphaerales bacterium]
MMRFWLRLDSISLTLLLCGAGCFNSAPKAPPVGEKYTEQAAMGMIKASRGPLAPVYAPLGEYIVSTFEMGEKEGVGIDLGSGPGTLILELCERTRLHWINADINPHFFAHFYREAQRRGLGHRVSTVLADAQALPFRDNYADIIVSRGSFHFWKDKEKAFAEIYRVLKPGAVAYIGRGFSPNLAVETARKIRSQRGGRMKYDVDKSADELRGIMKGLRIAEYTIHRPKPAGADDVNYGVWVEFHKK